MTEETASNLTKSFLYKMVADDIATGRFGGKVQTRFPPEPNGYLHIGHTKAMVIDFGLAELFGGQCNLRFDDTNPTKEETEFVEGIMHDIRWLGYDWDDRLYFASDYFEQLYEYAVVLIKAGLAYVDDLSADEIREYRGTLTKPGRESPHRNRSVAENLDLFERMRAGEFPDGTHTLRAKIDMASPNINMRDPVMYRIMHTPHHRTGDKWVIYPMYDWAHGQSDSIEGVTYSLADLAYEDHRPLYDWFLEKLGIFHPQQIEFARLNITYTVLSKRYLRSLVESGIVHGWDDPRMPTLAGMRRRGYPAAAIRRFVERLGVAKKDTSLADIGLLQHLVREELNQIAPRVMTVLDPLKLVITNYPAEEVEWLDAVNNPEDESAGTRQVPFSQTLYIERADFMEDPPRKYFRLSPGKEVRLKHAYYVTCTEVIKNDAGHVVEVHATYDPATRGGWSNDGRKVKGTLHWVSAAHAIDTEVRNYEHLFNREDMTNLPEGAEFADFVDPNSITVLEGAKAEPALAKVEPGRQMQFLRKGYYTLDPDSTAEHLVFNRTVPLKDTWAKIKRKS